MINYNQSMDLDFSKLSHEECIALLEKIREECDWQTTFKDTDWEQGISWLASRILGMFVDIDSEEE